MKQAQYIYPEYTRIELTDGEYQQWLASQSFRDELMNKAHELVNTSNTITVSIVNRDNLCVYSTTHCARMSRYNAWLAGAETDPRHNQRNENGLVDELPAWIFTAQPILYNVDVYTFGADGFVFSKLLARWQRFAPTVNAAINDAHRLANVEFPDKIISVHVAAA